MSLVRFAEHPRDVASARKLRTIIRRHNLQQFGVDVDGAQDPELDGRTLCAYGANRALIGTIDVHWGGDADMPPKKLTTFRAEELTRGAPREAIVVLDEPMIHPDLKNEPIGMELKEGAARFALRSGARFVFSSCVPGEVAVHEALGFVVCGRRWSGMPTDEHIPMLLDLADIALLTRVRSPLAALAKVKAPSARPAALPAHGDDVVEELDPAAVWRILFRLVRDARQSGAEFLSDIQKAELGELFRGAHVHTFPQGDFIIRQRERGRDLFLLLQGDVVAKRDTSVLGYASPGDVVGEMGFLREAERKADVVAMTNVRALRISAGHLDQLMKKDVALAAKLSLAISRALCRKLERTNATI